MLNHRVVRGFNGNRANSLFIESCILIVSIIYSIDVALHFTFLVCILFFDVFKSAVSVEPQYCKEFTPCV